MNYLIFPTAQAFLMIFIEAISGEMATEIGRTLKNDFQAKSEEEKYRLFHQAEFSKISLLKKLGQEFSAAKNFWGLFIA